MHEGLLEWLAGGERGVSSNTIVEVITGIDCGLERRSHPYDIYDFRRCLLLLERVPSLRPGLPLLAQESMEWSRLITRWDFLKEQLERVCPGWRGEIRSELWALFQKTISGRATEDDLKP